MMEGWQDREKEGLPRLIEAMHGHFWSSMERVAKPTSMLIIIASYIYYICLTSLLTWYFYCTAEIDTDAPAVAHLSSGTAQPPPQQETNTLAPPPTAPTPLISEDFHPSESVAAAVVKSEPVAVVNEDPELEGLGEQFTEIIAEVLQYYNTAMLR